MQVDIIQIVTQNLKRSYLLTVPEPQGEPGDFTPTEPLETENPEIDPPVVFHDPDGSWQLQFMGRSIQLPEPSKRGNGSWITEQSEAGDWIVTDGRHVKIFHDLMMLRRAKPNGT